MVKDADPAQDWQVTQCFGGNHVVEDIHDGDVVTAVEFDSTGDFLAVGDKAGRIWIYEAEPHASKHTSRDKSLHRDVTRDNNSAAAAATTTVDSPTPQTPPQQGAIEYKFYGQFQSHEPEFDYLKSLEIEEKINMIKWCKRQNDALMLLATNDKTIKLWKIYERKIKKTTTRAGVGEAGARRKVEASDDLTIPTMDFFDTVTAATPRRVFQNAHAYHINSVSINSDMETYISADDLRINLWNLEISDQSFNVVDIKPANMEELTEVITTASFHPHDCNTMMYSTSRGTIKLADTRESALCDGHAKMFEVTEDPVEKSFFSEIISSISDAVFTPCGRYIVARDYLTVKIWDTHMESRPLHTVKIHDFLQEKLCDLYENDCIFDKFESAPSPDGSSFVTGSYNEAFVIANWQSDVTQLIQAEKPAPKRKTAQARSKKPRKQPATNVDQIDFGKKALHVAWHPSQNAVAVACLNNLYLYQDAKVGL